MENRTYFTIGQAAEATGKAKSTIKKAIDNGELSVAEKTSRGFKIDAAALHSVFPIKTTERSEKRSDEQNETPEKTSANSALEAELKALREKIESGEAERTRERGQLEDQIADLRSRLDKSEGARERTEARLEDQRNKMENLLTEKLKPAEAEPEEEPVLLTDDRPKIEELARKGLFGRVVDAVRG